jgi:acetyl-CoA carboxylase biotin carboxyl carrier protein
MDIDFAELASLVALLKEADFSEFRYEKGDVRINVRRGALDDNDSTPAPRVAADASGPVAAPAPVARPAAPASLPAVASAQTVAGALAVKAPMLGTFYASPKPGEPAFVQVGDRVGTDTVLCIVEVMKLMNSVHAGVRGTVVAVHANNGDLVEFGQTLFSIQEDAA